MDPIRQTSACDVSQIAQDILDATSAIGGGTIGVVGTIVALELKKREIKKKAEVSPRLSA